MLPYLLKNDVHLVVALKVLRFLVGEAEGKFMVGVVCPLDFVDCHLSPILPLDPVDLPAHFVMCFDILEAPG